jgi:hypothetical protein
MPGSVFTGALRDARRRFVWWSVGLIGYVAVIAAVWPSIRNVGLHEQPPSVRERQLLACRRTIPS